MISGTQIDGTFVGVDSEAFYLSNARIIGRNAIAEVDFIAVSKKQFSHLNTASKKIVRNDKYPNQDSKKKSKPKKEDSKPKNEESTSNSVEKKE